MKRPPFCAALFTLVLICVPSVPASADVTDSTASGFTTLNVVTVDASPQAAYERLVKDVGSWWDPAHTWSGDSRNLSIESRAGGFFAEELSGGGSNIHMEIVHAQPARMLRMRGGLGPLQGMAITGSLTWEFRPTGDSTEIRLTYTVSGYLPGGMSALARPVDSVLRSQINRLKRYIETGKP